MTILLRDRARIKELAAELCQIVGGARRADGSHKTFDEIEGEAIELTDLLATAMMERVVEDDRPEATEITEATEGCRCPSCHAVGKLVDQESEPIGLETDRGDVDWMTTK